jgi:glycosyltransferase involved in cell wall biosynthesis
MKRFFVPEKDSKKLKEAVECILKDEKLAKSMGKCSREVIKNWTYPRMVDGFSEAVEYAVTRRGENGRDRRKESTRI